MLTPMYIEKRERIFGFKCRLRALQSNMYMFGRYRKFIFTRKEEKGGRKENRNGEKEWKEKLEPELALS